MSYTNIPTSWVLNTSSEVHVDPVTVCLVKRRKVLLFSFMFCLSLSVLCVHQWMSISTAPPLLELNFLGAHEMGKGVELPKGACVGEKTRQFCSTHQTMLWISFTG